MIICWWSACGGEGKTTFAVSQGYQLAKAGYKVALLDFSEVNPGCAKTLALKIKDVMPVYNAIENNILNENLLESYMAIYNDKLRIFTGVGLDRFEVFQPWHFEAMVDCLKTYDYIIIDTNPGIFFSGTLTGIRKAEIINMVVEPTYRSIKCSLKMIDFVNSRWNINREAFKIFVNKIDLGGLPKNKIKKIFNEIEISGFFKYNKDVIAASNTGIPFILEGLLQNAGINKNLSQERRFLNFFKRRGKLADKSL